MVESLTVKLGLKADGFRKGLASARRGVKGLNGALGMLGVGASVGAFMAAGRGALQMADDLGTTATKLGVTTDFLQEFNFAAEQSGVSAEAAQNGFQRFSRGLAQAQFGGGELAKSLQAMGIALTDQNGKTKDAQTVFSEFADGLANTQNSSEKVMHAFNAFGRSGVDMIAMLNNGSAGFEELRQQAREAGVVLEEDHIAQLDKADKSMKKFGQQAKVMFATFLSKGIRAFKIGQNVAEKYFDMMFANVGKIGRALKKFFTFDLDGAIDEVASLELEYESIGEMIDAATKEVDKQLDLEKKLTEETKKRQAAVQQTTKHIQEQQKAEQKMLDAKGKLQTKKRDRSLLTLDDLAEKEGKLEKTDPVIARLRQQLKFSQAGLSHTGGALKLSAQQERALLLAEKAKLYEELGKSLAGQLNFGRSQRAFAMADEIRKMNPYLKSSERNPMKVMEDQLAEAKKQVEELRKVSAPLQQNFPLKMQ